MKRTLIALSATLLAATAWAGPAEDQAALKLATGAGCMTCHNIEPGAKGPNGMAPIGPAWRDVAAKYKSVKGAQQQLTATVMAGSSPYESHWKDKVSGLSMPPNKVAISEVDAAQLVSWILALDVKK
ncbi:c-type cytochrome [Hydrogenophaga sp. NH-16]|jgi:cytochrome c|uniref:c-type cytochrome n=1 Tax=Hydrogenophaga sp. NH-16 TaxID=2184519 RepID=UPI000FDA9B98|nr:c-type cytochrome [Hydrogenophaga sp. NH-16]